uniref:Uncharacterized protein n=1 Tax=Oryza meridionalis TaxID=40149 RepID=A0A0E0CJY2_9ORYZ
MWRCTRSESGRAARTPSTRRSCTWCTTGTASHTSRLFLLLLLYFLSRTAMGLESLMCLALKNHVWSMAILLPLVLELSSFVHSTSKSTRTQLQV